MMHSLAVLPAYQGKGVGSTLLKNYIQLLEGSANYDRLAIIADASHVNYYEQRGFTNLGKSKAGFGGVEWFDLVSGSKMLR
jgi:predicted N-acetyltransferase YhbS